MTSRPRQRTSAATSQAEGAERQPRADARRNRARVLRSAQEAFASEGLDVALDEIARRAGVGPGTVHRHFPTKAELYIAVAIDEIEQLVTEGDSLVAGGDPAAVFTLLSHMIATGARNVAVKSALEAAELDLRSAAPDLAARLTRRVAELLDRARTAGAIRTDATADDLMALVAGAFTAIRHAGAGTSPKRASHIASLILDGLKP